MEIELTGKAGLIVIIAIVLLSVGGITMCAAEEWQDSGDKRACRRAGGTVTYTDHGEWRCVGASPEGR